MPGCTVHLRNSRNSGEGLKIKSDKLFTKYFQYLSTLIALLGMHGAMLLFAINSLIGAVLIALFLPETKGKSYEEISKLLN